MPPPRPPAPAERSAPPRDLEIRPKQVRAWIESLPLAQSLDTAKKLVTHLVAVNRAKVDVDDRVQILDIYRPVANTVLDELDAIYSKSALPLVPRAREALTNARELAFALADGYKIAIGDKTGKLIAFGAKKQLPILLLRTRVPWASCARATSVLDGAAGDLDEMHQLYSTEKDARHEVADAKQNDRDGRVREGCAVVDRTILAGPAKPTDHRRRYRASRAW